MLQPLLQEYLIETGSLPLHAAGQLRIQHTPAHLHVEDKMFIAPQSKVVFSDTLPTEPEIEKLSAFIGRQLHISTDQAISLLKKEMVPESFSNSNDDDIEWREWHLFLDKKESIQNSQPPALNDYLPSFPVEKIFRLPVTVIEAETLPTDVILEEQFPSFEPVAKDYWWVWVLALVILAVLLIINHFA